MSKPSLLPRWATGVSATVQPEESKKTTGFVAGEKPAPKVFNWLFNNIYGWCAYVSGMNEDPDFLSLPFVWTGNHRFQNGVTANDLYLPGFAEARYTNIATGAYEPRTRVKTFPWLAAGHGQPGIASGDTSVGEAGAGDVGGRLLLVRNASFDPSGALSSFPVVLPHESVLKGWRVLCLTNAQSFNFRCELKRATNNFAAPAIGDHLTIGSVQNQSGAPSTLYSKGESGLSQQISGDTQYWIEASITTSPSVANFDLLLIGVELTYEEVRASGSH